MIKAFFLDRDGVLIKDYGYVCDIKKIKWLKGAKNSIQILNKNKIKVIVVTNQSGVARGYFSEIELRRFHIYTNKELQKNKSKIDAFFYCPYHPKAVIKKYKKDSDLRKPSNGMLKLAIRKFKLKTNECFMIGDKKTDYLAAKKTKILFQYKKKCPLDKQIKSIIY